MVIVNEGKLRCGPDELGRIWDALAALPRWMQLGLAVLFVATTANMLASQMGVQSDLTSNRMFVGAAVWITAVGTALHYGIWRGPRPEPVRGRPYQITLGGFALAGIGLAVATFTLGRDPITDDTAVHHRLTGQFGGAAWYPHLVAVNTDHSAFTVYLNVPLSLPGT